MHGSRYFLLSVFFMCATAGCSGGGDRSSDDSEDALSGQSSADHSCVVTLRTAGLIREQPHPSNAPPFYKLVATVDVLTDAISFSGAKPRVRWIDREGKTRDTTAHDAPPKAIAGAPAGFQRFSFEITHDTIPADGSMTSLEVARVSIVPFVILKNGDRVFDHNRVRGDFDTYTLWAGDTAGGLVSPPLNDPEIGVGFEVKDAPGVCVHTPQPNG